MTIKEQIYNKLYEDIKNAYGVCGLMGNIQAESAFIPNNLENTKNKRFGMTDTEYTIAVDNGTYAKFTTDSAGYGLCQWTSKGRKTAFLEMAKEQNKSISDLDLQIDFLLYELKNSYKTVYKTLKSCTNIREASDIVLKKFECPADQSTNACVYRASLGAKLYNELVKPNITPTKYIVTASVLNVRAKSTTASTIINGIPRGAVVTVSQTIKTTDKVNPLWSYIPMYGGWVSTRYLKEV